MPRSLSFRSCFRNNSCLRKIWSFCVQYSICSHFQPTTTFSLIRTISNNFSCNSTEFHFFLDTTVNRLWFCWLNTEKVSIILWQGKSVNVGISKGNHNLENASEPKEPQIALQNNPVETAYVYTSCSTRKSWKFLKNGSVKAPVTKSKSNWPIWSLVFFFSRLSDVGKEQNLPPEVLIWTGFFMNES